MNVLASFRTIFHGILNAEYGVRILPWVLVASVIFVVTIATWSSGWWRRAVWITIAVFFAGLAIAMRVLAVDGFLQLLAIWIGVGWLGFGIARRRHASRPVGFALPVRPDGLAPPSATGTPQQATSPRMPVARTVAGLAAMVLISLISGYAKPRVWISVESDVDLKWREARVLAARIDETIRTTPGGIAGYDGPLNLAPRPVRTNAMALFTNFGPVPAWFTPADVSIRTTGLDPWRYEITISGGSVPGAPNGSRSWLDGEARRHYGPD